MIDAAIANLLTTASGLARDFVRPSTESVKVTDGQKRVLWSELSTTRDYTDDGSTRFPLGFYQLDIFAPKATEARALADQIMFALDGHKAVVASVPIARIYFGNGKSMKGFEAEGANQTTARYVLEMFIRYRE